MSSLKEKFYKRFSKVQDEIDKGIEKVELVKEKSSLNKEICDDEVKKTNLLLEMGELLYTKLRKNEIVDSDFDFYKSQITDLDKSIYDSSMKIKELEEARNNKLCECGSKINLEAKFCAQCGKKIEINNVEEELMICLNCDSDISIDSKFCGCCGTKIKIN